MTEQIDNLVEVIAQRVTQRLKEMGVAQTSPTLPCGLTPETCTYCGLCVNNKPEAVDNIIKFGAARISTNAGVNSNFDANLAGMIDHTILKPGTTQDDLKKVCEEAKNFHFATVCVNASNISFVARQLRGSGVKPIAVVGFPLGAGTGQSKAFEAKEAIRHGAEEIDMVINIDALKTKNYKVVYEDILRVAEASKPHKLKVIIEASNLNDEEKVAACVLAKTAGAAFVKTSTGFGKGGATVKDVALMRRVVGNDMEIKASGGIRTKEDAEKMIEAGADRIGASASIAIVTGKKPKASGY